MQAINRKEVTAEYVNGILHYDAKSGALFWKYRANKSNALNARQVGKIAGCNNGNGYILIIIDGYAYLAHRLAWLMMTGEWPVSDIDHKDADRSNNSWNNLRLATSSQNSMNRSRASNNASGYKGVCWDKNNKKWTAYIMANGKNHFIGLFECAETARDARLKKAKELHDEFARVA